MHTKTTITKSKAGHYWVRVRSTTMPHIFDGDAYSNRQCAQIAAKHHAERVAEKVSAAMQAARAA